MDPISEKKNNPWAICTSSVGRKDKKKYERCVMKVKKQTGYKESTDPVDQIAEMVTDDPDVISECQPNATWNLAGKQVNGVEFRDEPWEEAMHDVADTWNAGYKIMVFEDGLLMANDPELLELADRGMDVYFPKTATEALAIAKHFWWTSGDPEAIQHGQGEGYEWQAPQDPAPSDQFPKLESVGNPTMEPPVHSGDDTMIDQFDAQLDQILASLGGPATKPAEPETMPEVDPGNPDVPEPSEPDPFTPTRPAILPEPKARY